jgi:hypothetical protein
VGKCQGYNLVLELVAPAYDPTVFLGGLIVALGRSSRFVGVQKRDVQIWDVAGAKSVPRTGQQNWSMDMRKCKQQIVPAVLCPRLETWMDPSTSSP